MYIFLISLCLKNPRVLIFWNLSLHLKLIATEVCILSISTMCSKMIIFLFQMFLRQKMTLCVRITVVVAAHRRMTVKIC